MSDSATPEAAASAGLSSPPKVPRPSRIIQTFRDHPVLSVLSVVISGGIFLSGAAVSSLIGSMVEQQFNSEALAAAEIQQQQITDGTRRIEERVVSLQTSLNALHAGNNPADAQAFQLEAERLLKELAQVAPVIESAALTNADFIARLRHDALSRPDGATTTAAFELPLNGSATICRDFTVGIRSSGTNQVRLNISRRGETASNVTAVSGDTAVLRQSDASASVTVAGFGRGATGELVGIDYNCFEGTG